MKPAAGAGGAFVRLAMGLLMIIASGGAAATPAAPHEVAAALPSARLVGEGTLRWYGLAIYEARLWAGEGFDAARFDAHPFALELRYARRLDGAAIADRSLEEMRRLGPIAEADAAAWRSAMRAAFPDVRPGDRLTGLHDPAAGARFHVNGRANGEIGAPDFSRRFFAIWLAPQTSQPGLRERLLGTTR